jgi:hypothetical protein
VDPGRSCTRDAERWAVATLASAAPGQRCRTPPGRVGTPLIAVIERPP